jgi:lysophospholipase L1-like esterase
MNASHAALELTLIILFATHFASAQKTSAPNDPHWVATWGTSEQQPRPGFARPAAPPPAQPVAPATTSATAAAPVTATPPITPPVVPLTPRPARGFTNQTVRMVVKASIGGSVLRVHLSNAFGTTPVVVGAAHVALRSQGSAIVPGSDRPLAFNGKPSVSIPIGAEMISDPVSLDLPKLGELAVSVYIPGDSGPATVHSLGLHTTWISKEGDFTAAPEFTDADKAQSWFFVSDVDVQAPASAATIVAFGDSITDGATSTPDTDRSWPSDLAQRLAANPATANIAVVNQGISGNMVLRDGAGVSALARFDRDVLAQAGVKWLMILEGINDMNSVSRPLPGTAPVTADDLINAMKQMIDRAHTHDIKVIGCTLTPFGNASETA